MLEYLPGYQIVCSNLHDMGDWAGDLRSSGHSAA